MTRKPGFALAAALAAIVLIAVLITSVLFAAGQETRASRSSVLDQQIFAYAELAASRAVSSFNPATMSDASAGYVSIYRLPRDDLMESTVFITKLDSALFLIVAESRSGAADAIRLRRRVGINVRATRDSLGVERVVPIDNLSWTALY
ncbi:MAG: hypothetical protein WKF55_07805 [Gemmatimonadaceae bacterium]